MYRRTTQQSKTSRLTDRLGGICSVVLCGAVWMAVATNASAQTAKDESIMRLARPDFDPICLQPDALFGETRGTGGPTLICPSLTFSGGFEDNVFRTEDDTSSDFFTRTEPNLVVRTEWDNTTFSLGGRGRITRYFDETDNDSTDFELTGAVNTQATDITKIGASGSWGRLHVDREDPDDPGAGQAVDEYFQATGRLAVETRPSDFLFRLTGAATQLDFLDNGAIDNDDRDRNIYTVAFRGGYEVQPGIIVFLEPSYNIRRYDQTPDSSGFDRDSDGYDIQAGVTYDVSAVTFLEVGAGFFQQNFEDNAFTDESGFSLRGEFYWNPTDVLTVKARASRSVEESNQFGVSSVIKSVVGGGLEYEITEETLFTADGSYSNELFESANRQDNKLSFRVELIRLINEYLSAGLSYRFSRRESDSSGDDFSANTILATIKAHY